MSDLPLDTSVPIALHPTSLDLHASALAVENSLGAYFFENAKATMANIYKNYSELNATEKTLLASKPVNQKNRASPDVRIVNGVPTLHADVTELATAAEMRWKKLAPTIDKQVHHLTQQQAALAKKVSEAIEDPLRKTQEGLSVATSIRDYVKALPEGERMKFVTDAVAAGDKQTCAAIIHAPSYLSGLSSGACDVIRDLAGERFDPLHARQARAAAAVIQHLSGAGAQLMVRYQKTIALKNSDKAKADEALRALAK